MGPQGQQWYQTTTLEGNHDWDMWVAEGDTGFDNELTVGGEKVPPVQLGFVPVGYNLDAAGGRTGPKTIAVQSAGRSAGAVTLTLASPSATTLRAGQELILNLGGGGGGGGRGGTLNGPHLITSVSGNTVTFLARGNGGVQVRSGAAITTPDAGPAVLRAGRGHTVSGTVVELNSYIGGKGGVQNGLELNLAGTNVRGPVKQPIVTLSDLGGNDQMVFAARFGATGAFSIPDVPDGSYQLTYWDYEQDMIIDSFNVTVKGSDVSVGTKGLVDWWTEVKGSVFVDANGNGKRDPGESGVPKFTVVLKQRDNSLLDAGLNSATTDAQGNYVLREAYPITKWMVEEAFNTRYQTTGVTVQADNEPTEKTYLGAGVDISLLPVIGLSGRVDWGVKPFNGTNGGIAGTVTYDTTRNELDPAAAVTEPYQPGIPGMTVHLYYPLPCTGSEPAGQCSSPTNGYQVDPVTGAMKVLIGADGKPLDVHDPYVSETWEAPKGCTARMQDGTVLATGTDQLALPTAGDAGHQCVEAPMTGWQALPSDQSAPADGGFAQTVNGNYAFNQLDYDPSALDAEAARQAAGGAASANPLALLAAPVPLPNNADFVLKTDSPLDLTGKPIYKPTTEADVNVFTGDARAPQEDFPLSAAEAAPSAAADALPGAGGPVSQQPGIVSPCVGALHAVHVTDPGFLGAGGSPFEGRQRPYCDAKLVNIRPNQTVAPNFNYFTDVPLPTHFWGLTINDLGLSHDKTQIGYGEAQPLPGVPMGIYDWSGRLVDTVITDYNGMYESSEPSTSSYNCPLPAGPCPNMYYFKGNDPGQAGRPNKDYNPRYRTIGTSFQAWPGLWTPTDTAPSQVAQIALTPGSAQIGDVDCSVSAGTPNVLAVDHPYVRATGVTQVPAKGSRVLVRQVRIRPNTDDTTTSTVTMTLTATVPAAERGGGRTLTFTGFPAPYAGPNTDPNRYDLDATFSGVTVGATTLTFTIPAVRTMGPTTFRRNFPTTTLPDYTISQAGGGAAPTITVRGTGFGTAPVVTLTGPAGSAAQAARTQTLSPSPTDTSVTFTVGTGAADGTLTSGVYQLGIRNSASGKDAVNGLSIHVLGSTTTGTGPSAVTTTYDPTLIQVDPPAAVAGESSPANTFRAQDPTAPGYDLTVKPEHAIQRALDHAATVATATKGALVVVWPGPSSDASPTGDYYENLIIHSNVKLQGVGPGGFQGSAYVPGTRVDGLGFTPDGQQGTDWIASLSALGLDPATIPDAAVVTVLGNSTFTRPFGAAIDGLTITGGAEQGFPTNVNTVTGGTRTPVGGPGALVTQGGGVYVHSQATGLQLSNNIVVGNSGTYGGGIRVGTPYTAVQSRGSTAWSVPAALRNTGVRILHNRLRDNGGTNLAGGLALFDGSDGYVVDHNDLCGNFSAEYGGGLSHYGLSDGGTISFNRVYLNGSYDEGGGVMVAGELNPNLTQPSAGAAHAGSSLTIDGNTVERNLANDDGGGIRFLSAGNVPIGVTNNLVTDNVSTHEGGGFALDDSTNVSIIGNTVAHDITTATAVTSNGRPAPAGLSTAGNSTQLQAALAGTPQAAFGFSRPVLRDNVFNGNLAGTWNVGGSQTVSGIDPAGGAANPPSYWDIGSVEPVTPIPVTNTVLQSGTPTAQLGSSPTNVFTADAGFVSPYPVSVVIETSRAFPSFRQAVLVATNVAAPDAGGDYHLTAGSPARGLAALPDFPLVPLFGTAAPSRHDVDADPRPLGGAADSGADERS